MKLHLDYLTFSTRNFRHVPGAGGSLRRKLVPHLSALAMVMVIGTAGYMYFEDAEFLPSFYMTIITLSTVGYGEVIPLDDSGRILTVFLIISGITIGGMSLTTITSYIVSGELLARLRGRRMQKRLEKLRDHVILAGYGKLGSEAAEELARSNVDFCIIERDPAQVEHALAKDYLILSGDAAEDETLEEAGIHRAAALITALTGESGNVMVTITARSLNPNITIIARGVDSRSKDRLKRAGADRVELPFSMGAQRMVSLALKPSLVEFFDLFMNHFGNKYEMQELHLPPNARLIGQTIRQADLRRDLAKVQIMAIKRENGDIVMQPDGTSVFEENDRVLLLGNSDDIDNLIRHIMSD